MKISDVGDALLRLPVHKSDSAGALSLQKPRPKAPQIQRARHLKAAPEPKETVLRERMKSCIKQDRLEEIDVPDLAERLLMLEVVGAELRAISAALAVCDKISEHFNVAKRNPQFGSLTMKSLM